MFEKETEQGRAAPSLKRAVEIQLFVTYLVQQMRNAPEILNHLDVDELRQLAKGVDDLHQAAHVALDVAVVQRVLETERNARQVGA